MFLLLHNVVCVNLLFFPEFVTRVSSHKTPDLRKHTKFLINFRGNRICNQEWTIHRQETVVTRDRTKTKNKHNTEN